jgi:glycosyltransferase involved in cell wall biosynthesis
VLQTELNEHISFIAEPRKSKFDVKALMNIRKLISRDNPDCIVCLNFFAFFYARVAIAFTGSPARIVVIYQTTIHGDKKEHMLHKLYVAMLRKKDIVIAASVNQVKYTLDHFRLAPDSIRIIYNGIDLDYWSLPPVDFNPGTFRSRYNIPPGAKVIILAAAFRPEKNHLGAIRALKILRETRGENAYLLLAGEGVMRKQAEQIAQDLNLAEYVIFAGPQKDLRPFYWAADLFSLTSASVETFSIAALEAMSCGLPAVLTDIGGAREMVIEGKNGFLSGSDDESLAVNWQKGLNTRFDKHVIHAMIAEKYDAKLMVQEYKKHFE